MFSQPPIEMQYTQYDARIRAGMGVQLAGWPEGVTFEAPSKMGAGGADGLNLLWDLLCNKTCRWVDVPSTEHAALLEQFPKQAKNWEKTWKPRRAIGKAHQGAAEKAAGTSKGKKRKRAVEEVEQGEKSAEEEPPKKKKKGTEKEKEGDGKEKKGKKRAKKDREGKNDGDEGGEKTKKNGKSKKAAEGKDAGEEEVTRKKKTEEKGKGKEKAGVEKKAEKRMAEEEPEDAPAKKKAAFKHRRTAGEGQQRPKPKPRYTSKATVDTDDEDDAAAAQSTSGPTLPYRKRIAPPFVDPPSPEKSAPEQRDPTPDLDDPNLPPATKFFFENRRKQNEALAEREARRNAASIASTSTLPTKPSTKPRKSLAEIAGADSDSYDEDQEDN